MRLTRFALSILATTLMAGTALAQTAPAAPAIPPPVPAAPAAAHGEAAALTQMIGADKQSQQLISILRNQMIQLVMRAGGDRR